MSNRKVVVLFRGEDSKLEIEGVTDWQMLDDKLNIYSDGAVIASFYRDAVLGIRELGPGVVIEEAKQQRDEQLKGYLESPFYKGDSLP